MQGNESQRVLPRAVISITRKEERKHLEELFDSMQIPVCFHGYGNGTAPSEVMDILGLSGTGRLLTISFMPKFMVQLVFEELQKKCSFHKKGRGVAVSVPINGIQSNLLQVLNEETRCTVENSVKGDEKKMKEKSEYVLIWVSVVSGYSDDVIDAARAVGAQGGTVLKGRRRNSERMSQFFGISVQEEQDFVMMIVPGEKKREIMDAITHSCGSKSPAHGVVVSLPVDEVLGLES